jgi:hypothetical protein
MRNAVILFSLLVAFGFSQNLLTNGDFEQDLSAGWTKDTGGYGFFTTARSPDYQPDPDYEALDSLYSGAGNCRLSQRVDVPGPVLSLSFWAKFGIYGASSTCWPVAYVGVGYHDATGQLLGETRVYYHDTYCTWTSTSTMSLIEVTNPDWTQYSIDIAQELSQHLPGVNPADVRKLSVALVDTTAGG